MDLAKINQKVSFTLDGAAWRFAGSGEVKRFHRRWKNPGGGNILIWCCRADNSAVVEQFPYNDIREALDIEWSLGWIRRGGKDD